MSTISANPYRPFTSFVFRSPYLPLNLFTEWLNRLDQTPDYLKEILARADIREALFIASPVLYGEIPKYLEERLKPGDRERFEESVIKYLSRMATRCTPFGLFAGCSVGQLGDHTDIQLSAMEKYSRHTRLDMNFLCAFAFHIARMEEIKHRLLYFPNSSAYVSGRKLRYVKYRYRDGSRYHSIEATDNTDHIKCTLSAAKGGATVEQLAALLMDADRETSREDAMEFLNVMIDNQILVSEMEPSVTGPELLDQIIDTLEKLKDQQELVSRLRMLSGLLQEIDSQPIGTTIPVYGKIREVVAGLGGGFNVEQLYQSDMIKPCEKAEIGKEVLDDVLQGITLLNKLSSQSHQNTLLDRFASSFADRYDEREIPLAQLLDSEAGLTLNPSAVSDITPLLDGIPFGGRQRVESSHSQSGSQSRLYRKVMETVLIKEQEIVLTDDDIKDTSQRWDNLPHTISVMCEIFSYDSGGSRKIYLHNTGGSSAANMLGRFCHVDNKIEDAVKDIIRSEEQALPQDKLYAEVVHLPASRIGNVLARTILRPYEIPYLARPAVGREFQLDVSDLMVSVRHKKLVLRSQKLDKEVIPRLTTAHNYSQPHAMPVYQFLGYLQNQHLRGGLWFNLSGVFNELPYLPRISYRNIILSLARWHVKPADIKQIVDDFNGAVAVKWKARLGLPRYVVLPDGDNELFVDTESPTSMRILYSVVKKRPQCTLREFPFDVERALLKDGVNAFTNEWLFTFHKTQPA